MDRYESTSVLQQHGDRRVSLATDRLTHRPVILKEGPTIDIVREATLLLALPPQTGPSVIDLYSIDGPPTSTTSDDELPVDESRCALVMHVLDGQTLDKAVAALSPEEVPGFAIDTCNILTQLHLARFIHGDVKPSNLMILPDPERPRVRLLDFGFALGPYTRLTRDTDHLGGTPAYMAPEIAKGWMVDGRADEYSFALVLRALLELLKHDDPRWTVLLDRASQKSASRRFPSIRAFRDAIAEAFAIPLEEHRPRLGGGPFQGRDLLLEELDKACAPKPARQLLCGQPGTGTTRVLLEAWITRRDAILERALQPDHATDNEQRQLRVIDLTSQTLTIDAPALDRYLQSLESQPIDVVVGLNDYTPRLSLTPGPVREVLQTRLDSDAWHRERIDQLDLDTVSDIVGDRLGSASPTTRELGDWVYERSEGDMHLAGRVLDQALVSEGAPHEDGEGWSVSEGGMARLKEMETEAPKPDMGMVPEELLETAVVLSRLGPRFTEEQAQGLLAHLEGLGIHHCESLGLEQLQDHGIVRALADNRWTVAAVLLRTDLRMQPLLNRKTVGGWIHKHVAPSPIETDHVREAVELADSLGEPDRGSELLASALEQCYKARAWHAMSKLMPEVPIQQDPSAETARIKIALSLLSNRLGSEWPMGRLLVYVARMIKARHRAMAMQLWSTAAGIGTYPEVTAQECPDSPDRKWAVEAATLLLGQCVYRSDEEYEVARSHLLKLARSGTKVPSGIISLHDAWRARLSGNIGLARSLAHEASESLSGSGLGHEFLAYQYLAILYYAENPERALRYLAQARGLARVTEQHLHVAANEAKILGNLGRHRERIEVSRFGLRHTPPGHRARRRVFRYAEAWSLVHLGRSKDALRILDELLGSTDTHADESRVLGYDTLRATAMHQLGHSKVARDILERALEGESEAAADVRMQALGYLADIILDTQDHPAPPLWPDHLRNNDSETAVVRARWNSLASISAGRDSDAIDLLESNGSHVHTLEAFEQARYFYCLSIAYLRKGDALGNGSPELSKSQSYLRDAAKTLPRDYAYRHACFNMTRAQIEMACGRPDLAAEYLSECIEQGRRTDARGLLRQALQLRVQSVVESTANPTRSP